MVFNKNIESLTLKNENYRKVLHTDKGKSQLVIMSLIPGEDIPKELHNDVSQFFRIESGKGVAIIDGKRYNLKDGIALIIPPGTEHYIKNTSSSEPLKLYSIYSPDNHPYNKVNKRQPKNNNH